jgi:transposase
MARKSYSMEFRRQAVDLYESTPGATLKGIAAELGIVRGTLRHWVDLYGTGKTTSADGTTSIHPMRAGGGGAPAAGPETPEQELTRLRAGVRALEVETTKLATEREMRLRRAGHFHQSRSR